MQCDCLVFLLSNDLSFFFYGNAKLYLTALEANMPRVGITREYLSK